MLLASIERVPQLHISEQRFVTSGHQNENLVSPNCTESVCAYLSSSTVQHRGRISSWERSSSQYFWSYRYDNGVFSIIVVKILGDGDWHSPSQLISFDSHKKWVLPKHPSRIDSCSLSVFTRGPGVLFWSCVNSPKCQHMLILFWFVQAWIILERTQLWVTVKN